MQFGNNNFSHYFTIQRDTSPFLFVFDDFEQNLETDTEQTVKKSALDILTAVLSAIRKTGSESKLIMLYECASAREVSEEGVMDWLDREGLRDPNYVLGVLLNNLEKK